MKGGTSEAFSKNKTLHINAVGIGRGGQGRFGSCGGSGGRDGRGCGGRGRAQDRGSTDIPYCPLYSNININIETIQFPKEEFRQLSTQHKSQVQQMNIAAGWINGYSPLHGLILKSDGYAVPSPSVISAAQASFFQPP